jgi:hypothetical protein
VAVGSVAVGCVLRDSDGEGTTNMLEQKFCSDGEEVAYISRH